MVTSPAVRTWPSLITRSGSIIVRALGPPANCAADSAASRQPSRDMAARPGLQQRLQSRRAAGVVKVAMRDNDELDVLWVETERSDVVEQLVAVGTVECVDQHVSVRGDEKPGRDPADA